MHQGDKEGKRERDFSFIRKWREESGCRCIISDFCGGILALAMEGEDEHFRLLEDAPQH